MDPRLRRLVNKIEDEALRQKVSCLLSDLSVQVERKTYTGLPFEEAPAAIYHHHSHPGGLIEHVLSMANIALAMCESC